MTPKLETYISVDIECDGPVPGINSMLSVGAVAVRSDDLTIHTKFTANLKPDPALRSDPNTMIRFWSRFPDALAATKMAAVEPFDVMHRFGCWVRTLERPIFVAYPLAFDLPFVQWYFHRYGLPWPFRGSIDLRSLAMGKFGCSYEKSKKRNLPLQPKPKHPHTHIALDDAIEQAEVLCAILRVRRE